ncbi:unnamed protein product [Sphenostylis stenocarpa]|uniref:Uncharacterized protein n=1 Tax=Sphenostylis stenocarpa TaxID=92480 RepID=A0AA86VY23_9FABA|nr:unnamed protein product [Sphenostylis stenocarpa]
MVAVQGSKVPLPHPSSLSPSPHLHTSILFEPSSLSLALTHTDSSLSLYPSFSPLSPSFSPHQTQTLTIPSPSSSSTFLLLQQHPSAASAVIFLVSSPHRSRILLRLYRLRRREAPSFARVTRVLCSHKDLCFEPGLGVILDAKHGAAVRLAASVNYFALYALSSNKVWVFAVKDEDGGGRQDGNNNNNDDDSGSGAGVRLMRCAVIECARPVFSLSVAFGFLILGEENGIRVFGLRRLVKGKSGNKRFGNSKHLRNGGGVRGGGLEVVNCNGDLEGKMETHGVAAAKVSTSVSGPCFDVSLLASGHTLQACSLFLVDQDMGARQVKQTVKSKHDDRDGGSCFVVLKGNEVNTKSATKVSMSIKAISVQAVSQRMFLILDSHGDSHLLSLSHSGVGVDIAGNVRPLPRTMEVRSIAVFRDLSNMSQTIWISDGCHSVHMFAAMDIENALNEADGNDCNEKLLHLPVLLRIVRNLSICMSSHNLGIVEGQHQGMVTTRMEAKLDGLEKMIQEMVQDRDKRDNEYHDRFQRI